MALEPTTAEIQQTDSPPTAKSLVRTFADKLGVDQDKMMKTLKDTAFKQPAKRQGQNWVTPEITNEQMMALLVVANRYDLNPFVREIYAFPDRKGIVPIVGVDGWSRMINNHPQFDGMEFEYGPEATKADDHHKAAFEWIKCSIYRKDRKRAVVVTEFFDEVYRKPFETMKEGKSVVSPGPWQSHTKRMHRHKAMIQCARLAFGYTGIYDQDEGERVIEGAIVIDDDQPTRSETLSARFGPEGEAPAAEAEIVETATPETAETPETEVPEPEPNPKPDDKTKPSPPELTAGDILKGMADATRPEDVASILEDAKGIKMSKAKRLTIKAAADARLTELLPTAQGT